ncbi:hypothetical protein SeLEV6574_g05117 [Synchytrium endobioticum]|uniref:Uncharacterized protein n=1 Tax=Synchytrium endobioticum TaxID=286115 RepID=A0A507CW39_9FUNG|nr:hypothetical protein SeLEV6574_g05117 [Synchytrium endobioticum]
MVDVRDVRDLVLTAVDSQTVANLVHPGVGRARVERLARRCEKPRKIGLRAAVGQHKEMPTRVAATPVEVLRVLNTVDPKPVDLGVGKLAAERVVRDINKSARRKVFSNPIIIMTGEWGEERSPDLFALLYLD